MAALPTCSAKVCCYKKPKQGDLYLTKVAKLCNMAEPVPPPLAPGPVVSTCFAEAFTSVGYGGCPGAPTVPPMTGPVFTSAGDCFAVCFNVDLALIAPRRTVCGLGPLPIPITCDVVSRIFGSGPSSRMAKRAAGGAGRMLKALGMPDM